MGERKSWLFYLRRRLRYFYLRLIALRGSPGELALGMALGIFVGMMPIMPFQIAVAISLALLFRASKITAAVGTWISNPATWYVVYYYDYKLGSSLLGISPDRAFFSSVMRALESGESPIAVISKIVGAGGTGFTAFLIGGSLIGVLIAIPSYFIWLGVFRYIRLWRRNRTRIRK
ncbi:MAG: DUF2062 domain-containing protein [Desulfatiglandaceae bacterium]